MAVQALSFYENDLSMERTNEDGVPEDGWEPYATITTNIPNVELGPDEIIVKNWSENSWVGQLLTLMPDVFQDTGRRVKVGFVEAPVWKFTPRAEVTSDFMDIAEAVQIVLDLAQQNVIDIRENAAEHARQMEAIDTVTDFAVNHLGDD